MKVGIQEENTSTREEGRSGFLHVQEDASHDDGLEDKRTTRLSAESQEDTTEPSQKIQASSQGVATDNLDLAFHHGYDLLRNRQHVGTIPIQSAFHFTPK